MPFSVSAEDEYTNADYVPGEIIITTSSDLIDASSTFVTANENYYTMVDFEENEIINVETIETYTDDTEETSYLLEIDGDIEEKCKDLEKIPGVLSAEPNLIFHTYDFTMPAELNRTSGLYPEISKWYFDLLQIPTAWQTFETAGENVVIAIIDNGYNINSLDFPTNLWKDENGNIGWNTAKDSADISPIYKSDGTKFENTFHGSNVAGVIGMLANGKDGVGAAYKAQLMLINAASYLSDVKNPSFTVADLIEAVDYARIHGADIINMSLGVIGTVAALEDAIDRAYEAGIAIIAAAGNSAVSTTVGKSIPASYDNVIGVMASDKINPTQLAQFSNYDPSGKYYDVVAPGVEILGCSNVSNSLSQSNGTSQAAPLVAACAALYLSEYPNATVDELYEAIRKSPKTNIKSNSTVVTDTTYNFKLLNAVDLLEYGKVDPEVSTNITTNATIDKSLCYIWGLDEGFTDIGNYISIAEGTGTMEIVPTENGIGTGTVINVYDIYGDLRKSYTIIIFGDINGDTLADGQDAVLDLCIINFADQFSDAQKFAADVDFDGAVTESDYSITANKAISLDFITQIK
jgi:hypothetical protein